jgi:hypothetical protein
MKSLSDRVTEMGMEASWRVGAAAFSVFNEHRPHPDFMKGCELGARREMVRVRDSFLKLRNMVAMWDV